MKQRIDLLIDARWVIPVIPRDTVFEHYSVAIDNGYILAVVPSAEAAKRFEADDHVELLDQALIPGLINLHSHAAMNLFRGMADDKPLMAWLNDHIWPAEQRHVSADFVREGTLLACAEMLKSGITCFNDLYFFPDAIAEAAHQMGMRANIGFAILEFSTPYAADSATYLERGLASRDKWKGEALLSFSLAPHAPYTVANRTLEQIAILSEQLDLGIHMHLHETRAEIDDSNKEYGLRPLARLEKHGIVTPRFIAIHAVHLIPEEIDLLARHGCHVAHCPSSNLKLGSGIAPLQQIDAAGINYGFGTDGAASNNRLDILSEMRLASLLAKGASGDAAALPAARVLEQATLGAARALGLSDIIGSIEAGKAADLVSIDFRPLELAPCFAPVSHLVYTIGREHVSHVWVMGQNQVKNGILTRCYEGDLIRIAKSWQNELTSH